MIPFGPLTSRRLGYSLGINHIPVKYCTYDCVYCQVGPTKPLTIQRQNFYTTETIKIAVEQKLLEVSQQGKTVDAITFVPDGEPGLDLLLGEHLRALKPLGIKLAIISNASLLTDPDVRQQMSQADWVSVKVDSVDEVVWRKINRPYGRLRIDSVLQGIVQFAKEFSGVLVTETMLVQGLNEKDQHLSAAAKFVGSLPVRCAYLSLPSRPPMEDWVRPPSAERITAAYQLFKKEINQVEILGLVEPNPFVGQAGIREALLSTAAVHPLDRPTVLTMLAESGADWAEVKNLVKNGLLKEVFYEGETFYIR